LNTALAQASFGALPVIFDVAAITRLKLRVEQSSLSAFETAKTLAMSIKQRNDFMFNVIIGVSFVIFSFNVCLF
jgi:hypothetical protein